MDTHRFTPFYKPSPDGRFRFQQPKRGLGESGIVEILPLVFYNGNEDVYAFTQYRLQPCRLNWQVWNNAGTRCCFMAIRYAEGAFPVEEDELEILQGDSVVCVIDIGTYSVVAEHPVSGIPEDIVWNDDGKDVTITVSPREKAYQEYDQARRHMNSPGTVTADDPMNDPTRLEYYLFYYDARYCGPDPFAYATQQRNKYLKAHGLPIPYDENIMNEPEPED